MKQLHKGKALIAGVLLSLTLFQTTAFAADYKVVKDDSLYKIGQLFGTSISTLKTENKLQSDTIYPGQVLYVNAKIHNIQKGDTLYLISKKYDVTLSSLRKANNKWDDLILPGQKLIIPASNTSVPGTPESPSTETVIPYTQQEVDLLARLITAEATGQPYDAMVGVGAVVVNRVKSTEWPNTISSVINHVAGGYYQFTPVKNGYIKNPASDVAVKATWDALYGKDPSKKAMFYYDDSCTNEWILSKPVKVKIGRMVFAE